MDDRYVDQIFNLQQECFDKYVTDQILGFRCWDKYIVCTIKTNCNA